MAEYINHIGITDYRNHKQTFGIKPADRLQHMYVIGKSGTGKSTLMERMAATDILQGNGVGLIDPHAEMSARMATFTRKHRPDDLVYLNATDKSCDVHFNPLASIRPEFHHLVASGLISTFKKIWIDSWGPRMEYILRFALLTLLKISGSTLLDIQPLLTDKKFREDVLAKISDEYLWRFWRNEFEKFTPTLRAEAIAPILNKMGLFVASDPLRRVVGHSESSFRFRQILDQGKVLVVNLSKGEIGEDASSLLGAMLIQGIQLAALNRAGIEEARRKPYYLYVDECQSFITLSFSSILAEARKYGLSLFLAHQYLDQLDERVRAAIFGNVGTIIAFRLGPSDAAYFEREFYPVFSQYDLINLPRYAMYLKLQIDGTTSAPFSARSLPII